MKAKPNALNPRLIHVGLTAKCIGTCLLCGGITPQGTNNLAYFPAAPLAKFYSDVDSLWDINVSANRGLIFSRSWIKDAKGNKPKGFNQSLEHVRLVEQENYKLFTFDQIYSETSVDRGDVSMPTISSFEEKLIEKTLLHEVDSWYVYDGSIPPSLPEEVDEQRFPEGALSKVTVNRYERDPKARRACLKHYGYTCQGCSFDFKKAYGDIGSEYIHVHHIVSLSKRDGQEYEVDPIRDLIPVCPNCHAIIHRCDPDLSLDELKSIVNVSYLYI